MVVTGATSLFGRQPVTHISGVISPDVTIKNVVLMKESEHPTMVRKIGIPVVDGRFAYDLETDTVAAYYLIPKENTSSWSSQWIFFSEGGDISFEVFKDRDGDNELQVHTDRPATKAYQEHINGLLKAPSYVAYLQLADSATENRLAYTSEFYNLGDSAMNDNLTREQKAVYWHKMDSLRKSGTARTELGKNLDEMAKIESEKWKAGELAFAESNRDIPGMLVILQKFWFNEENIDKYADIFNTYYIEKFAGHPYADEIEVLLKAKLTDAVAVGGKYPDVEALDTLGVSHRLSEFINGKVAIIDLWASWCGPCRENSIALIPVYEKYAPKGLAVIGIARETDDDQSMRVAMQRDGYPWPSLVEINDSDHIWAKFGIPNAPGRTLLVDQSGTILAIDPKVDDVHKLLDLLLK